MFQNGLGLTIKKPQTLRKQTKTGSTNTPWAYIREGLLSEGFMRLRFGGLILGGLILGGAYYRNFTLLSLLQTYDDGS